MREKLLDLNVKLSKPFLKDFLVTALSTLELCALWMNLPGDIEIMLFRGAWI